MRSLDQADHPFFQRKSPFISSSLRGVWPDNIGRSLSQWDCPELVRQLKADGIVETISPKTVERILRSHKLKPWRHHLWLSPGVPRDAHFAHLVRALVDLYTRPLTKEEIVLSMDEKTNLQPRQIGRAH